MRCACVNLVWSAERSVSAFPFAQIRVAIRGGGDLGSGVAYRLHQSGFPVLITELAQPLLVRRMACFGSAAMDGSITVEGITARRVGSVREALSAQAEGTIPVLIDPDAITLPEYEPTILIDARMRKANPGPRQADVLLLVGLGPGFHVPEHCDVVVETARGHNLGRVIRSGAAQDDTGTPEGVLGWQQHRVLRAPQEGILAALQPIGARVREGEPIAQVGNSLVIAPFDGVLRGLIHDGLWVTEGMKVGDLDPRADPAYCFTISDKALAVGGGVLEAVLSAPAIRERLRQL